MDVEPSHFEWDPATGPPMPVEFSVGLRLGPTGGRIVAEVVNGLLQADPNSYVSVDPGWTPTFADPRSRSFTMADLVRFTLGPTHG